MVSELLYALCEAAILEVEEVANVTYPQSNENPSECVIETLSKEKYMLTLKAVN